MSLTADSSPADGALGLYSAVGDALTGRKPGFGRRRAALASRFARYRGADDAGAAASWCAGLLADAGHVCVAITPEMSERRSFFALADAALHGARLAASIAGLPAGTADQIRWHREYDDGTGVPDGLRWDGIPIDAAALGIVNAFLETMEDPDEPRAAGEALFAIIGESGRCFRAELVRAFRQFVSTSVDTLELADDPALPLFDDDALLAMLALRLDARDPATARRSERLADIAAMLAEPMGLDPRRARQLAQLLAFGRATPLVAYDGFDPLSRFARERRSGEAQRAATIAAEVARYAADAPLLAETAVWYEQRPVEPLTAILAVALAVDALEPLEAPRLVAAAAGTQFDPEIVRIYLATTEAPT